MQKAIEKPIFTLIEPSDARQFAIAVEDVSNGLLYAQSLARLGRTDEARRMLDTIGSSGRWPHSCMARSSRSRRTARCITFPSLLSRTERRISSTGSVCA